MIKIACLVLPVLLVGCTSISTTKGGVVGVDREQYMADSLPSRQLAVSYANSYRAFVHYAAANGKLLTDTPKGQTLQKIAIRLIAQAPVFKPSAAKEGWFLAYIDDDKTMNATCGPGGKIAIYSGLVQGLKLTDDEVAAVLGHEIAHSLREHSREQASSQAAFEVAGTLGASALGAGGMGQTVITQALKAGVGLPFSRRDETEADLIGLELAARAGFDPRASISLWKKIDAQGDKSNMPGFLRTHPSNEDRMQLLSETIPKVMPLYVAAAKQ
ncbi:M48 family metallopeptidase [Pseudomonas laurylsulfatiphila]|uniref:M48 family metallopeptidase n=1 Tax=Pseudomonas TaxID=286 RepID=UPI003D218D12